MEPLEISPENQIVQHVNYELDDAMCWSGPEGRVLVLLGGCPIHGSWACTGTQEKVSI